MNDGYNEVYLLVFRILLELSFNVKKISYYKIFLFLFILNFMEVRKYIF